MATAKQVKFEVGGSWSARRTAEEARAFTENLYRPHPEILELLEHFQNHVVSETELWPLLTSQEREGLEDLPLVVVPTGEFDVWIAAAPSGNGKFIVFDLCILLELTEFFSAIADARYPAWAACILQGARRQTTGPRLELAKWVEAPLRGFLGILEQGGTQVPYSSSMLFGLPFCMEFLLAHECGHQALGHFGGEPLAREDNAARLTAYRRRTNHDLEFAADAWGMNVISRLPAFELSSRLLSIELMFWYMNLVESFKAECRRINGMAAPPDDHPPLIMRAERISRLGEKVFEAELDETGNLPESLFNNLQDRQRVWGWIKKFDAFTLHLAECYCSDPDKTVAIHEAVRAGEHDMDIYSGEMKAIAQKHRHHGVLGVAKRIFRYIRSKLF